jgi:tetratricopeptide (TPR) repeat protein
VFKFAPDQAEVLKPYALPLGEEAYKTFVQHYGFTPKGPILIEIFPEHDQFAVRTIGLPGIVGALGACFGRVIGMDSPTARIPLDFSWHATEWHELAHVFTLQLSDYRVPRWLTEGISVFEEHRKEPAWGRELTLEFAQELGVGKTFGVKGITEAFKHPENYSMAYFEASLIVEHLVALNGDEGLRTLLKAYAAGDNDDQAFTKAFGKSLDDVDKSFNAFVEQQYGPLRDAMKQPATRVDGADLAGLKARAAAAPGNFPSQVSYGQALFRANDFSAAKAPLERAAELAPQASGDGSPHALLADIAEKAGDSTTARKELRALLTYDHANVGEARELAKLALAAKAEDDADFALRRVADLDPFDAEVHGQLGQRLMAKNDFAGALIEFQAALAQGPTNKAEAHANVAEAYLKLDRKPDAKREALEALKEAPTYARAQDLLLAAIGKR